MPKAYVYLYLEDGPVPAGLLETIGEGRKATAQFAPVIMVLTDPKTLYLARPKPLDAAGFASTGHAAPFSAHSWIFAKKSRCGVGTGVRPSPGDQPQSTSGVCICSTICSGVR
jgi:hypothetical protein